MTGQGSANYLKRKEKSSPLPLIWNLPGARSPRPRESYAAREPGIWALTWGSTLAYRWLYRPPSGTAPGSAGARLAGPWLTTTRDTAPHAKEVSHRPETAPQRFAPARLKPGNEGSAAHRFRTHLQPQPMTARKLQPVLRRVGARAWKPKVAFGQLDEISPNFLSCIPEGPTGGVASSF